ncbi:MAG: hypothetical protein SF182_29315 [Deltaproteobacteria bacterium]|nr:hypothetical protein [Deltaproteobacteria bacterium]
MDMTPDPLHAEPRFRLNQQTAGIVGLVSLVLVVVAMFMHSQAVAVVALACMGVAALLATVFRSRERIAQLRRWIRAYRRFHGFEE